VCQQKENNKDKEAHYQQVWLFVFLIKHYDTDYIDSLWHSDSTSMHVKCNWKTTFAFKIPKNRAICWIFL